MDSSQGQTGQTGDNEGQEQATAPAPMVDPAQRPGSHAPVIVSDPEHEHAGKAGSIRGYADSGAAVVALDESGELIEVQLAHLQVLR